MPEKTFSNLSLRELTEHIVAQHHAFLRRELPRISELFHAVQTSATASSEAFGEAENIFTTVRKKIETHLRDEEQFLFPVGVCLASGETPDACELDLKVRLEEMEREHDNAGIALEKCRDLITVAADTDSGLENLASALSRLIDDLTEHVRIENEYIHPILKRYIH